MIRFLVSVTINWFWIITFFNFLSVLVHSKDITVFDGFCREEKLYDPYLRYYHGRHDAITNGDPFKDHAPGFYNDFLDPNITNTYLCINGLAWLYYKITTVSTVVYEVPELHRFVHHCMLVNGVKGPAMITVDMKLLGILLVGHPHDYRQPGIQIFTAPFQEPCDPGAGCNDPKPEINATSIMMLGDYTECILSKGQKRLQMRIRSDTPPEPAPTDDYSGTFCKISFKHLETNLKDGSTAEIKTAAEEYFVHDQPISKLGCWLPQNYTDGTHSITLQRFEMLKALATAQEEFEIEKYFDKPERIPKDPAAAAKPLVWPGDTDPCATPADCEPEKIKQDIADAQAAIDAETDPTKLPPLEMTLIEKKLILCTSQAFQAYKKVFPFYNDTIEAWEKSELHANETKQYYLDYPPATKYLEKATLDFKTNPLYATDPVINTTYENATLYYGNVTQNYTKNSIILTPWISTAESKRMTLEQRILGLRLAFEKLVKEYKIAKRKGMPYCMPSAEVPMDQSRIITIKRDPAAYLVVDDPKKNTKLENDPDKTCGEFPKPKETCEAAKPDAERAHQILQARINRFVDNSAPPVEVPWKAEDEWRKNVFEMIEDIFTTACTPMLRRDFVVGTNRIMRGYLTEFVKGTLPLDGSTSAPLPLPTRRPFWDQIMEALDECRKMDIKLHFKRVYKEEEENFEFVKKNKNGTTENVALEHFLEQADAEYAFNWAIDSNWRAFATVMGLCMPAYETKVPLITSKFFSFYTEDFLYPLTQEWVMNRDNAALRYIMGEFYGSKGDLWSKNCMEASYLESGDLKYRPPRKLLVNAGTEANFFNSGPLAGTSGMYV